MLSPWRWRHVFLRSVNGLILIIKHYVPADSTVHRILRIVCLQFIKLTCSLFIKFYKWFIIYRVAQEERSVFWEATVLVILHKKKKGVYVHVLFPVVSEIELFHCEVPELLIRKRYCILFLIPLFIVQVTELVQEDSKGFWQRCITLRIIGFLDVIHRLVF
jgi:hypothetical protein